MTGSSTDTATARGGIRLLLLPTVLLAACSAQRPITAVKARAAAPPPNSAQQVMASLPPGNGPAVVQAIATGPVAPIAFATATVSCPAGTMLIGGGIRASIKGDGTPSPSQHLVGAFPSTSDGTAATASAGSPSSWTAIGATGAQPVPGANTMALGICDRGAAGIEAPQARHERRRSVPAGRRSSAVARMPDCGKGGLHRPASTSRQASRAIPAATPWPPAASRTPGRRSGRPAERPSPAPPPPPMRSARRVLPQVRWSSKAPSDPRAPRRRSA
jgi:hypothetical protein